MNVIPKFRQNYIDSVIAPIITSKEKTKKQFPRSYYLGILEAAEKIGSALDKGKTPKQAEAETDGMDLTGYMLGWAVNIVCTYNPKGKLFQKYWNSKFGQPDAEGTINPAILVIGEKK